MAKFVHDDVMDALLSKVKTDAVKMAVCKGDPATYSAATKSSMLAIVSVSDLFVVVAVKAK